MLYLGCDPDMHTCAFAVVNADLTLRWAWVERVTKKIKEHKAIVHMAKLVGGLHTGSYIAGLAPGDVGAAAVEAQEIYLSGPSKTPNPRNILHLAPVAGSALTIFGQMFDKSDLYFPLPVQWKGSLPKDVHHKRILTKAGFSESSIGFAGTGDNRYGYVMGTHLVQDVNKGDWKHTADAIGLAQWAATKHQQTTLKDMYLKRARGTTTVEKPAVTTLVPHNGFIS